MNPLQWRWLLYIFHRWDGKGNSSPLQCPCLEKPMDRGAWQATVHGVTRVCYDWAHTWVNWGMEKWGNLTEVTKLRGGRAVVVGTGIKPWQSGTWQNWQILLRHSHTEEIEREMAPTPVFLSEASHRQRSLVICSPWGYLKLGTTEQQQTHRYWNRSHWRWRVFFFNCKLLKTAGVWF